MSTSWVPLAESGIGHALYVEPPFESSITLDGSTIVADNATRAPGFGIGWNLEISVADVPEYFTGRVRVTTQIDYVDAPESGPLDFQYSTEDGGSGVVNEHEDSTAFVPNPAVLGPLAPWSGSPYGLVQFTAWGIDVLSATFYIEVEVQDDGPPSEGDCFWTDLVNVTQECGNAPDPEPPESPHLEFVVQGFGTSLTITRLPAGSVVHWGDGEVYVAPSLSGSVTHNYFLEEGVTAQGHIEFPDDAVWDTYFNFSGTALAAVPSWGEQEIPARLAFINCPNLTEVPTEGPPPGATSMDGMFMGAPNLTSDITGWDTSNITSMMEVFLGNASFNQDISGWDTSSVTRMHRMFQYASSFNQPIGSWDVSNVTGMVQMFDNASSFNQDLSGWCVSEIASEPSGFRSGSPLSNENCPVWGTCP